MFIKKPNSEAGAKPNQQQPNKVPFVLQRQGFNKGNMPLGPYNEGGPKVSDDQKSNDTLQTETNVSDYNTLGSNEQKLSTKEYAGSSFFEGLVKGHFIANFTIENKSEQATVYEEIWDNSPKKNNIPYINKDTEVLVGIELNSGYIQYYSITYKKQKNKNTTDGKYFLDVKKIASSSEGSYKADKTYSYPPKDRMKERMLGRNYGGAKYDHTFPAVEGQDEDRMGSFFENSNNSSERSAYYGYLNTVYSKSYYQNKKVDSRISKLKKKPEKATYANELSDLEQIQNSNYEYPFRSLVKGGQYTFLVFGRFKRANIASEIGLVQLEVICLSGPNAGVNPVKESQSEKSFSQGKIEAHYQKHPNAVERPNMIILGSIPSVEEQNAVEQFIFDTSVVNNFENRYRDTHFDQELIIDGQRVIYSFTISEPKTNELDNDIQSYISVPENKKRIDIYIERQGEIGTAEGQIADPEVLRINDVFGFSDDFNVTQFVDFVTQRYSAIKSNDILGDSKTEKINSVNSILNKKGKEPNWYKNNSIYNITILNSTSDIKKVLIDELDFYISGESDSAREQARVKGKTDSSPGKEVEDSETGAGIQPIQDETEGVKPWTSDELKYLEMSLQKFSPQLLNAINGLRYFRQDYNKLKDIYNIVGGLTFQGAKTIGIFDSGMSESTRVVGEGNEFTSAAAWTITHETGHVAQRNSGNGKAFNDFFNQIDQDGPTRYSRSFEISNPESEFFPEALTLYFHDPEFLAQNFPRIYLWFYVLNSDGKAPSKSTSAAMLKKYNDYLGGNDTPPSRSDLHKIVSNE